MGIVLFPGFEAQNNCDFIAEIIPCADLSSSKKENVSQINPTADITTPLQPQQPQFKIFPNPTNESFNILFLSENFKGAEVKIAESSNKLIKCFQVSSKLSEVKVNDLAVGTYLINIMLNGKSFTTKLIKN